MTYLFIEALKNKTFGNLNQAGYLFNKYSKVDSTCSACYFEISKIYLQAGEINNAIIYGKKCYKIDSLNYWYIKNYAELLRINKNYELAYELYIKIVKNFDGNIEDRFSLGSICLSLNKKDEGLTIFNSLEKEYGISEKISIEKYKFFINNRKYNDAYKILDQLIKLFPDSSYLYGLMAELYANMNKINDSKIYFDKYIKKDSLNANALYVYGKYLISIDDTLIGYRIIDNIFSNAYIKLNDKFIIIRKLIIESKNDKKHSNFYNNEIIKLSEIYDSIPLMNELACDYYESTNEIGKALKYSKELINDYPNSEIYWERYFFYLNILKSYDTIIYYSNSLLKQFNNKPFLFLISGVAYFQRNRFDDANLFFKSGLEISGDNEELRYQFINFLAESYYKINKIDSAYYYFDLAVENDAADITLFNNYAYYLAENNNRLIKALELSRLTLIKFPKSSTFLDTYAWICYKMKNYNEAYNYIKLAYKYSNKKNSEIIDHYGDILFCNGYKIKARNMWLKALKITDNKTKIESKIKQFSCQ